MSRLIIQENYREIQTEPGSLIFYTKRKTFLSIPLQTSNVSSSVSSHIAPPLRNSNGTLPFVTSHYTIKNVSLYNRIIATIKRSPAHCFLIPKAKRVSVQRHHRKIKMYPSLASSHINNVRQQCKSMPQM